ncbi:Uncharacterised protein [Mycobacteroides abscessus subsp. abscessus]|nr:Uncharacterised protein [Mycobacteroides abscessus subsp. abscessus]
MHETSTDPNSPTEMFAVPTSHRGIGPSTRTERFPSLRENRDLPTPLRDELVSLLGSHGSDPARRLGLSPDSDPREIAATARRMSQVWRERSTDPQMTSRAKKLCGIAAETCDEIVHDIDSALTDGRDSPARRSHPNSLPTVLRAQADWSRSGRAR